MTRTTLIGIFVVCVAAGSVLGETRRVPTDVASIQGAINASADGDVVIVEPGIYYETINFGGKDITVTSTAPNDPKIVGYTILNAEGDGSVVTFENGETPAAVLTGFTLTGGFGTYSAEFAAQVDGIRSFAGAGVYCNRASPTIAKNVIVRNIGPLNLMGPTEADVMIAFGGGIASYESNPRITGNIIKGNSAWIGGGILCWFGEPIISNNIIYDNSSYQGGGIFMFAGDLINNTFVGNDCGLGAETGQGEGPGGNVIAILVPELAPTRIVNNLICNAVSGSGILWQGDINSAVFAHNNVWSNFPDNYMGINPQTGQFISGGDVEQTGRAGNISADPLFLSTWGKDYHLMLDSPCINAGDLVMGEAAGPYDIDGEDRVYAFGIDIGADEYVGYVKPVAFAGYDQHVLEPLQPVTLDGLDSYFYDPLGFKTYQWTQVSGAEVVIDDPTLATPTFTPESEGEYVFELTVADDQYPGTSDQVLVFVGANQLPVAHAGSDKVWQVPGLVVLDGTESYDPDPVDRLSYSWTQLEGPEVTLQNADTATPAFTAEAGDEYVFELAVSDGFGDSEPSQVRLLTVRSTIDTWPLSIPPVSNQMPHFPDVSGTRVVFAADSGAGYNWKIAYTDFRTEESETFTGGGISLHPKIEGDWVVWAGGARYTDTPTPDCTSVFARHLARAEQVTLRERSDTESYSHPAISGNTVVWVQHRNLDKNNADQWRNMPYDICGADISDLESPTYFTVATGVGRRDPLPYGNLPVDYDGVVDLCGTLVVWEGDGDIYGADISDLSDIKVFTICDDAARQYDPAISGSYVVWTDERNDAGDIYGADISDPERVRVFDIVKSPGSQGQPAIDNGVVAYVEVVGQAGRIKVACITRDKGVMSLNLPGEYYGLAPVLDGTSVAWLRGAYGPVEAVQLAFGYSIDNGPIQNVTTGRRYDYIQHAIADGQAGDEIVVPEGVHYESLNFVGRAVTVRSTDPGDPAVVAATVLQGAGDIVTFGRSEGADSVLDGLTLSGGSKGIYCYAATPTIKRCTISANRGSGVKMVKESRPEVIQCRIVANVGAGVEMWAPSAQRAVRRCEPLLRNCVIAANRLEGIRGGKPHLVNCTVVENQGVGISSTSGTVTNSIIYFNDREGANVQFAGSVDVTYSDVQGAWTGTGNIDADPQFVSLADGAAGDYHLRSQGARWDSEQGLWTLDAETSPCIDAGDPASSLLDEPLDLVPGGVNERVNMGAYGGTVEASAAPAQ